MLVSLYVLATLYTNTMGLIIIAKCKPIINREIEAKGYIFKEKDDVDYVIKFLLDGLKFLIPGYFLKKAINLTSKDFNVEKLVKEKINNGEIIVNDEAETSMVDSIFKADNGKLALSLGKYEKQVPYKSVNNTMYSNDRIFNDEEVDMDFWQEEVSEIPVLEEAKEEEIKVVKKEPLQDYLESISESELILMAEQLDKIRKLKKANEDLLNNKVA